MIPNNKRVLESNRTQDILRKAVKSLHEQHGITYKHIVDYVLDMNYRSFLGWLAGNYNFGTEKQYSLTEYLKNYDFHIDN